MKTKTERELQATEELLEETADKAEAVINKADEEDRDPTESEREEITEHQRDIKNLKVRRDELQAIVDMQREVRERGKGIDIEDADSIQVVSEPLQKSLGEQFVESVVFESLKSGHSGKGWNSPSAELMTKGTLLEAPGTALTPAQYRPGIVETLFQAPTVAALMPSSPVSGPVVRYVEEGTGGTMGSGVTNAAAGVAQGGAKPESALAFEEVQVNVSKIATLLPVSDEMLEDAAQIQSYINNRLSLFIQIEEDDELLNGTGTNEPTGFLAKTGVNTYPRGTVDNNAVAIFKAAEGTRGSSFLSPDSIIMNPANWQTTRLLTDTAGQFFGGGPFTSAYGGQQGPVSANHFSAPNIWGLNVVVTSAIGSGTALLGNFRSAAEVYRRSGIRVEATNSHSTYFANNLTAIRAEERLALAIYRPGAFTKITGLS